MAELNSSSSYRIISKGLIRVGREGNDINGLCLLFLDAPPTDTEKKCPVPTIMRVFRTDSFESTTATIARKIRDEINTALSSIILSTGGGITGWNSDFERGVLARFSSGSLYRRYWLAASSLVVDRNQNRSDGDTMHRSEAQAFVDGFHGEILASMNATSESKWISAFEAEVTEATQMSGTSFMQGGSLVIEFSPPIGEGLAARDLSLGYIVAPTKDRNIHFRIIGLEEDVKRKVIRMRLSKVGDILAIGNVEVHPLVNVYVVGKESLGDDSQVEIDRGGKYAKSSLKPSGASPRIARKVAGVAGILVLLGALFFLLDLLLM